MSVNSLLGKYFGVKLSRVSPQKTVPLSSSRNGFLIEFMGASGVGKTTLRNHYLKHHKIKFPSAILTEQDLKSYKSPLEEEVNSRNSIYNSLYDSKLQRLSKARQAFTRNNRLANLFFRTLSDDYLIRNYLADRFVFMDQHVFKFFAEDFLRIENDQKKEFLKNRIIIYCKASPEKIIENIHKRTRSGTTRPGHQTKKDTELYQRITAHLDGRKKDLVQLKKAGVTILEINTENSLDKNTGIIDEYLGCEFGEF